MQCLVIFYCFLFHSLTLITVAILILNHTSLDRASDSRPTLDEALDRAYSRYLSSNTLSLIELVFSASPEEYSVAQFTGFILIHRF
jgi:hypothetical protein